MNSGRGDELCNVCYCQVLSNPESECTTLRRGYISPENLQITIWHLSGANTTNIRQGRHIVPGWHNSWAILQTRLDTEFYPQSGYV